MDAVVYGLGGGRARAVLDTAARLFYNSSTVADALTEPLDFASETPVYSQIRDRIKFAIARGAYGPDALAAPQAGSQIRTARTAVSHSIN